MSKDQIKVSVYDDNIELLDGLSRLIKANPGFILSGAFPDANSILDQVRQETPDVILMDIEMPGLSGIEATKLVHTHFPDIRVVMQTVFEEDEKVFQSICNGAVGYILKRTTPQNILKAITEASQGGVPMSPPIAKKVLQMVKSQTSSSVTKQSEILLSSREKEILTFLTKGLSYKMIASECNISIDTVRFHIKGIYEALHVHSMSGAVAKAIKDKLV